MLQIEKVTHEEASAIIETRERRGLFWLPDNKKYIGIDNTTGDAWVEAFRTLKQCERWLERKG